MSGSEPPGMVDRVFGICLTLLGASIALYCAIAVIKSILPFLVVVIGVASLVWLIVVVIRTIRERW